MLYQETVAHHPGERVQWRPCWQGDDSGCCPDCQRGVWGEEAGRGWGSLWDQQRQDVRAGVVEQQAVEGSEHQGRRGRSVYLWFLLSDTDMKRECSRCIRYKRAIKFLAKTPPKKTPKKTDRSRCDQLSIEVLHCRRWLVAPQQSSYRRWWLWRGHRWPGGCHLRSRRSVVIDFTHKKWRQGSLSQTKTNVTNLNWCHCPPSQWPFWKQLVSACHSARRAPERWHKGRAVRLACRCDTSCCVLLLLETWQTLKNLKISNENIRFKLYLLKNAVHSTHNEMIKQITGVQNMNYFICAFKYWIENICSNFFHFLIVE